MTVRTPLELDTFDAMQRELERALADPLATSVALRTATGCISRHGAACRKAMASGGDLRRAADQGRTRIRRQLLQSTLPALDGYFEDLADRGWRDEAAAASIEDITAREAAGLLKALAEWERTATTDTEVNALVSRICTRMVGDARRSVDRFKAEQSPEDSPDYRAVAETLAVFEAMIFLASHLDRPKAAEEIGQHRDHYAKTALLAALTVIQRAEDAADMFVHFDIATMLVSVENVVVVISRTLAVVDRERDRSHPHVEAMSEHVVRDFAMGLKRLAPAYQRMLRNSVAMQETAVPQFAFSVLRVLVQIARLIRILHHLIYDASLAVAADGIAEDIVAVQASLRRIAASDPDLLSRLDDALVDLGSGRPQGSAPLGAGTRKA